MGALNSVIKLTSQYKFLSFSPPKQTHLHPFLSLLFGCSVFLLLCFASQHLQRFSSTLREFCLIAHSKCSRILGFSFLTFRTSPRSSSSRSFAKPTSHLLLQWYYYFPPSLCFFLLLFLDYSVSHFLCTV